MAKYKMTLFARFFIFLIIVIPVAYIAAAYINGQDGIAQIMSLFENGKEKTEEPATSTEDIEAGQSSNEDLLKQKTDSIELLKKELEECRKN